MRRYVRASRSLIADQMARYSNCCSPLAICNSHARRGALRVARRTPGCFLRNPRASSCCCSKELFRQGLLIDQVWRVSLFDAAKARLASSPKRELRAQCTEKRRVQKDVAARGALSLFPASRFAPRVPNEKRTWIKALR